MDDAFARQLFSSEVYFSGYATQVCQPCEQDFVTFFRPLGGPPRWETLPQFCACSRSTNPTVLGNGPAILLERVGTKTILTIKEVRLTPDGYWLGRIQAGLFLPTVFLPHTHQKPGLLELHPLSSYVELMQRLANQ